MESDYKLLDRNYNPLERDIMHVSVREKKFLDKIINLGEGSRASDLYESCTTCNNCGSGDCASCCEVSDD